MAFLAFVLAGGILGLAAALGLGFGWTAALSGWVAGGWMDLGAWLLARRGRRHKPKTVPEDGENPSGRGQGMAEGHLSGTFGEAISAAPIGRRGE